jgi:hypothetical protein
MRTYYRGPEVLITDKILAVAAAPVLRTFEIDELYDVVVVRGDLDPARVITAHVAGGALVVVVACWRLLDSPAACLVALAFVVAASVISGACWRLNPRSYELRATYLGYDVQLYCSTDLRTFGQVKRGLMRALEGRRQRLEQTGAPGYP